MIAFIDDHREVHGVEPICKGEAANAIGSRELPNPIAPSTYRDHVAKRRSREAVGAGEAGLGPEAGDRARLRRELRGLWRAQGLAADAARRLRRRALHGRAADGRPRPPWRHPRQADPHHGARQGCPVPTRPCEPGLPCPRAEQAVAVGLHLCQHLVGPSGPCPP